jgi:hypothetical protein
MFEVPAFTPVITPLVELIEATAVLLLIHETPPVVALLKLLVAPLQITVVPVIAAGTGLTVVILIT